MLFTRLGRIVAFLALLIGIWYVAGGLMIATGWWTEQTGMPEQAALARYFGSKATTGAVIDSGIYTALIAIALGILTEINSSVRAFIKELQG